MIKDNSLREYLGQNAYKESIKYSSKNMYDEYNKLYLSTLR